jgi:hypothetical protein
MKNIKHNFWFLVPAAIIGGYALLSLAACAPQREVQHSYTFTPPADDQGMACAGSCVDAHKSCLEHCEKHEWRCNKFERKAVEGDDIVHAGKDPECSKVVCENRCADMLSSCYTGCGGQVTKDTTVSRKDPTAPTE